MRENIHHTRRDGHVKKRDVGMTKGLWVKDLTAEGVEPNPGPGMGASNGNGGSDVFEVTTSETVMDRFKIQQQPDLCGIGIINEVMPINVLTPNADIRFGPYLLDHELLLSEDLWKTEAADEGWLMSVKHKGVVRKTDGTEAEVDIPLDLKLTCGDAGLYIGKWAWPEETSPMGALLPEFQGLGTRRIDSDIKNQIAAMSNFRGVNLSNYLAGVAPLYRASLRGGNHVTMWLKMWLDFLVVDLVARSGANRYEDARKPNVPARLHKVSKLEGEDVNYVNANMDKYMSGNKYLYSMGTSDESMTYLQYTWRYASPWPLNIEHLPTVDNPDGDRRINDIPIPMSINLPGADEFTVLLGNHEEQILPSSPSSPSTRDELLGYMNWYMLKTGSWSDCMTGFELASALGVGARPRRLNTIMNDRDYVNGLWSKKSIRLPNTNSLPAFFEPFTVQTAGANQAVDLLAMRPEFVGPMMYLYNYMVSASTQEAAISLSMVKECWIGPRQGHSQRHFQEIMYKIPGQNRFSKFDGMVMSNCAWMFGFSPSSTLFRAITRTESTSAGLIKMYSATRAGCVPALWSGFEGAFFTLCMNERYMPPVLNGSVRWPKSKQIPVRGSLGAPAHVRLARTFGVFDDMYWLNDSGPMRNAAYYYAALAAEREPGEMKAARWIKPREDELPTEIEDVPLDNLATLGFDWILKPGQLCTYCPVQNRQLAWGLKFKEGRDRYKRIAMGRANETPTLSIYSLNGSRALDSSRVIYHMPAVEKMFSYLVGAQVPKHVVTPKKPVQEQVDVASDGMPTAPGNDNDIEFEGNPIKMGGKNAWIGTKKSGRSKPAWMPKGNDDRDARGPKANRFAELDSAPNGRGFTNDMAYDTGVSGGVKSRQPPKTPDDDAVLDKAIRMNALAQAEAPPKVSEVMSVSEASDKKKNDYAQAVKSGLTPSQGGNISHVNHQEVDDSTVMTHEKDDKGRDVVRDKPFVRQPPTLAAGLEVQKVGNKLGIFDTNVLMRDHNDQKN